MSHEMSEDRLHINRLQNDNLQLRRCCEDLRMELAKVKVALRELDEEIEAIISKNYKEMP